MLAVLSEINCLNQLQAMEVYPDFFSTDFEAFKNHTVTFTDCTVCIILAGINRFYRKHLIELTKNFIKLVDADNNNITEVIVITDATIPSIGTFYKIKGNLKRVDEYNGWNLIKENYDIWSRLKSEVRQPVIKLSAYDRGILEKDESKWVKRKSSEDNLIPLIKVPNIKALLN